MPSSPTPYQHCRTALSYGPNRNRDGLKYLLARKTLHEHFDECNNSEKNALIEEAFTLENWEALGLIHDLPGSKIAFDELLLKHTTDNQWIKHYHTLTPKSQLEYSECLLKHAIDHQQWPTLIQILDTLGFPQGQRKDCPELFEFMFYAYDPEVTRLALNCMTPAFSDPETLINAFAGQEAERVCEIIPHLQQPETLTLTLAFITRFLDQNICPNHCEEVAMLLLDHIEDPVYIAKITLKSLKSTHLTSALFEKMMEKSDWATLEKTAHTQKKSPFYPMLLAKIAQHELDQATPGLISQKPQRRF